MEYFLITLVIHNNFEIRYIQSNIMTALVEVQPCFDFYFKQAIESMQFSVIWHRSGCVDLFILINLYFIYTKINYDKIKLITGFIAVASSSSLVFRFTLCLAKLRGARTRNIAACEQLIFVAIFNAHFISFNHSLNSFYCVPIVTFIQK